MNVENRGGGGPIAFSSFKQKQRRMALRVRELSNGAKLAILQEELEKCATPRSMQGKPKE